MLVPRNAQRELMGSRIAGIQHVLEPWTVRAEERAGWLNGEEVKGKAPSRDKG